MAGRRPAKTLSSEIKGKDELHPNFQSARKNNALHIRAREIDVLHSSIHLLHQSVWIARKNNALNIRAREINVVDSSILSMF